MKKIILTSNKLDYWSNIIIKHHQRLLRYVENWMKINQSKTKAKKKKMIRLWLTNLIDSFWSADTSMDWFKPNDEPHSIRTSTKSETKSETKQLATTRANVFRSSFDWMLIEMWNEFNVDHLFREKRVLCFYSILPLPFEKFQFFFFWKMR